MSQLQKVMGPVPTPNDSVPQLMPNGANWVSYKCRIIITLGAWGLLHKHLDGTATKPKPPPVSRTNVQFHDYPELQRSSDLKNRNLWIKTFKMVFLGHVTLSQHVIKSRSHDQVIVTWLCDLQVTLSQSHVFCHTHVITGSHVTHLD